MSLIPILIMALILLVITILLALAEHLLVNYGACKISINKEKILNVTGGGYLMEYFTRDKIFIPSACGGKATCGHCKVKILSGGGSILPTEEVYINKHEKEAGIRLSCQVKVKNDLEIYIQEHLLETKMYTTKVESITPLTHDIKQIILKLIEPETISMKPGQYIQIAIPGTEEFRAYSVASPISQKDKVELDIRLVPGGLCSTYIHKVLEVGDKAIITGPFGDFYLNEESDKNIICIAGGCGMAPIRSILFYLAERNIPRKVMYFFGARSKKDLFYTEELKELERKYSNFKYIPALSEPKASDKWDGEVGLITNVLEKYITNQNHFEVYIAATYEESVTNVESYLCGPPPMIDAAIAVLNKKGINNEDIYFDKF